MKNILIPSNLPLFRTSHINFKKNKFRTFYFGSSKDLIDTKNFLNFSVILEKAIDSQQSKKYIQRNIHKKKKNLNYIEKTFYLVSKRVYFGKIENSKFIFQYIISELFKYLKKNKIDIVFFHSTPHLPSSVALYYCCKVLKIKILILEKAAFDYVYLIKKNWYSNFLYNFKSPLRNFKKFYKLDTKSKSIKIVKNINKKDFDKPNLVKIIFYFIKRVIRLIFLKSKYDRDSYFHFVKTNYRFTEIKLLTLFIFKRIINKFLYNFYFSSKKINFNKKYIYFSLGYEPEGTNCPTGGIFQDQLKAIKLIRKSINDEIFIYVKEHPSQFHIKDMPLDGYFYKNLSLYKNLQKIKNVIMVKTNTKSEDLIENAEVTCTISSTAGWESLMVGKKSLIFSYAWYSYHKNCLVVRDGSNLTQKKIKNFINKKINLKELHKDNKKFINNLANKFLLGDFWPKLYSPKNLKIITSNFFQKLSEIL